MPSDHFSPNRQVAIAVVPICTGFLSFVGSCCIISIIARDYQEKLKKPYHRLLLGVGISDLLNSILAMSSTFLMPADTEGVWKAFGTWKTCQMVGFLGQLGFCTTIYTASLAIYFLIKIRSSKLEKKRIGCVEPLMHAIAILFPFSTAIAGLFLEVYNPVKLSNGCWVSPYPSDCLKHEPIDCVRGANSPLIIWVFGGFVVSLSTAIVLFCMVSIYCSFRSRILLMEKRYAVVTGQNKSNSASVRLRHTQDQAMLYIATFLMAYLWIGILRLVENDGNNERFFYLSLLSVFFFPLQGFFNFLIYVRPRYISLRLQFPENSAFDILRILLGKPAQSSVSSLSTEQDQHIIT